MFENNKINFILNLLNPVNVYYLLKLWYRYNNEVSRKKERFNRVRLDVLKKRLVYFSNEKLVRVNRKLVLSSFLPPFPSKAFDAHILQNAAGVPGCPTFPVSTYLAVTDHCPMNCWHCSHGNRKYCADLDTSSWFKIIDELQKANISYFLFTGGEPLLRHDLELILEHAKEKSSLAIATNGWSLTENRAKALKKAGLFYLLVSLDHHTPEIHDNKRGYHGAFDIAIKAIQASLSVGLYTIVQTVFTPNSIQNGDFGKMVEFVKNLGAHELRGRGVLPAGYLIDAKPNQLFTRSEEEKFIAMAQEINKLKGYPRVHLFENYESETKQGCSAGAQHSYIDAAGNVYPCDFVPMNFGNILKEPFVDIWSRVRRSLGKARRECLAKTAQKLIAAEVVNKFPIPLEKSIEICSKCPSYELPDGFLS